MQSTFSRPVFRRLVGAVVAGVALTATSGCTVPVDAVAGISVTGDGHLLGVLMVCGHQIDGATLYGWTKDSSWSAQSVSFTSSDRDRLAPGSVLHSYISDNGNESAVTIPMAEFKAGSCPTIS